MHPIIRVLIVNDDLLMRNMLHRLLAGARDMHLVDEITELQHCVARCLELQPHVMLICGALKPFVFDVAALTAQVARQTRVIAILAADDTPRAQALRETNLAGCVFQDEIDETLLHVIRAVAQGNTWFSRTVIERLIAPQAASRATNRKQRSQATNSPGATNKSLPAYCAALIMPRSAQNWGWLIRPCATMSGRFARRWASPATNWAHTGQSSREHDKSLLSRKNKYKTSIK